MLDFDIWTIVFSVINILVLFFFLKKFLFGRVGAMLEKACADGAGRYGPGKAEGGRGRKAQKRL